MHRKSQTQKKKALCLTMKQIWSRQRQSGDEAEKRSGNIVMLEVVNSNPQHEIKF